MKFTKNSALKIVLSGLKPLVLVLMCTATIAYASAKDNNAKMNKYYDSDDTSTWDFHYGLEVGDVGDAGTKYSNETRYADKSGYGVATGRSPGDYESLQFGIDTKINEDLNITYYLDYSVMKEFFSTSSESGGDSGLLNDREHTQMPGIGINALFRAGDRFFYTTGLELHSATFTFNTPVTVGGDCSGTYNICSQVYQIEYSTKYTGSGATLSAGVLYKRYLFKLLYIYNQYTDPEKLTATSAGASIGFDF